MSTAKFEKLIDLIINEDQERAEQLFHEIVVEKSREIYESLMDEEVSPMEEDMTSGLMDEIEAEESSDMTMEDDMDDEEVSGDFDVEAGDEDMGDMDDMDAEEMEMGAEEAATKDDIMDLEDKLDQLMAAFEAEFGEAEGEEEGEEELEMGDEEEGEEEGEEESGVMESVELKKVAQPKGEDHKASSPVAANAGGSGPMGKVAKPVNFSGNGEGMPSSPKAPSSNAYHTKSEKEVKGAGSFQNAPAGAKGVKGGVGVAAAKPETKQASGVNVKDVVPESKKPVKKMIK